MDSNLEIFRSNPWDVDLNQSLEPLCPPPTPIPRPVKIPPVPCGPVPPYPVCPPGPEPDVGAFITKEEKDRYDRAFIVVGSFDDLDRLKDKDLHDGKIVGVLDKHHDTHFFQYDESKDAWEEFSLPFDVEVIPDETIYEICEGGFNAEVS